MSNPDYSHLATEALDSRYALAAHYLAPCGQIVEVGGARLHTFMDSTVPGSVRNRFFYSIDPTANSEYWHQVMTYRMPISAFNFRNIPNRGIDPRGLCILGLELHDEEFGDGGAESIGNICEAMALFDYVVVEYVQDNRTAYEQAHIIEGACRAVELYVTLDFETKFWHDGKYSERQQPNASFFKKRKFLLYRKAQ